MERKAFDRFLVLTVLVMALVVPERPSSSRGRQDDDQRPRIAPIETRARGPDLRPLGCRVVAMGARDPGRREPAHGYDGRTLCPAAGGPGLVPGRPDHVLRLARSSVTVRFRLGKSLFFPLINNFYGAFLNDPPETRTEEFVRAAGSCTEPAQISVRD